MQGRDDDPWEVALTGPQRLPEVSLLRLGGHTGRRAGAHHVDENGGDLHHGRRADSLGHEGEATAGGRAHGPYTGVAGPDDHVRHSDLVLHLPDHDAQVPRFLRKPVQDAR